MSNSRLLKKFDLSHFQGWLLLLTGLAILILGILSLLGWITENTSLIFAFSSRNPILFNVSLSFVLIGIALISLQFFKPLSLILSLILFFLSVLTFYEYLFEAQLGIDEIFVQSKYTIYPDKPGRIPPFASISIFFSAVAIFLLALKKPMGHAPLFISSVGLILIILNSVGILSFFLKSSFLVKWGSISKDSIQTSVIFFVIGLIFVIWAFKAKGQGSFFLSAKSTSILIIGVLLSVLFAELLIIEENRKIAMAIDGEAHHTTSLLETRFSSLLKALVRLSFLIDIDDLDEWKKDKFLHQKDFPYLSRMAILGPDLKLKENELGVFDEKTLKQITKHLDPSKLKEHNTEFFSVTNPIDQVFYFIFPITEDKGFIITEVDMDYFVTNSLNDKTKQNFNLSLQAEDYRWYGLFDNEHSYQTIDYRGQKNINIGDKEWLFRLWPTANWLTNYRNWPAFFIFLVGIFLSLFIAILVHYRQSLKASEQNLLQQKNQLLAANEELDAFTYSVSHDLRAPLRHIEGFIQSIEKNDYVAENEGKKLFTRIKEAAKRMSSLIDALLFYSHSGRNPIEKKTISLNKMIENILQETKTEVEDRKIVWRIAEFPLVEADEILMKSVLTNLISNALKFTRDKKETLIEMGFEEKPKEYVFYIKDNGIGFDEAAKNKLFGVFQRLDPSFEGVGIGLANVKKAIVRHGGRVWAEGKLKEGATFYFSIPKS